MNNYLRMTNYCTNFQTINSKVFMEKKNRENAGCMLRLNKASGTVLLGVLITLFSLLSLPANVMAQSNKMVRGKVISKSGEALPGVTIAVKGTTTGTITDSDGNYTLAVGNPNSTLVYSFIGFKPAEIVVASQTVINVTLEENTLQLEEVVAIGYGTMKKSDLTGSVSRASIGDKASLTTTNLIQSLSGSTAGVNIQSSGLAGSNPDLSIRGKTSLSASDRPLIVLDGIIYNGDLSNLNISDIESVDILKDASAAAVYGSRSANGVLIVTTKKGTTEKPTVSFNMSYGSQEMTNNPMKVMNAQQYAVRLVDWNYQQSLYTWYKTHPTSAAGKPVRPDVTDRNIVAAALRTQEESDNYLAGKEINWVDEVLRSMPIIQNYNLSYSGKSERSSYFVSGSYAKEQGIQLNDQFSRFTVHSNIESKIANWLTLGLNTSYSYRDYSGLEAQLGNNYTEGARAASPLANNKIGLPNYDMNLTGEVYMPYPLNNLYVNNSDTKNDLFIVGSAKVTVPWVKGLTYELNYSNTYSTSNTNNFYPVRTPTGALNNGQAEKKPSEQKNYIVNNIVTYLRSFGDHQINATLLYSRENARSQSSAMTVTGFSNPVLGYNSMQLGTVPSITSNAWEENSISYMARANYSYKNRYMVTGTVRRDGFSGFGPNNKFATFPSVSLGWVASEESFLKNAGIYSKLRLSYGENGNQGIGRYSSFSTMTASSTVFGSSTAITVYPNALGNADLGWESTASFNLGIDYGFLHQRISGSIDIYKANTSNVLVQRALPPTAGYANVWANIGGIENKGIELTLNTINIKGKLNWTSNFTLSLNRDKITKLYGGANDKDIGNGWFVGQSITSIYDYQQVGIWTEKELYAGVGTTPGTILANWYPGQFKYADLNKDGVIDATNDRKIIGNKAPNYRFSINNTLTYNNFSLSFLINSIQGGNGYYMADNSMATNVAWDTDVVRRVNASAVRPYWTPDNGVTNATGVYNAPVVHGGVYQSRSFVRLQDVSLSYSFKPELLKKIKIGSCQFFISGKNLYTLTKWSGLDPEIGVSGSPLMRNVTAGFKLTL
jgi:TonB-dependent starch-binding outer membrane protein SusC